VILVSVCSSNVKPVLLAMGLMMFYSCCLACSVISLITILFRLKLYALSLCCSGWLDVVCVGFL